MLFATIGQWKVFVAMMAAGLLVGLVYDLLAALRRLLRAGPLLSLCADLAFGLAAALVLGGALTFANYGQMPFSARARGPRSTPSGRTASDAGFCAPLCANFDEYGGALSNFVQLKSFFAKGKRPTVSNHNNMFA